MSELASTSNPSKKIDINLVKQSVELLTETFKQSPKSSSLSIRCNSDINQITKCIIEYINQNEELKSLTIEGYEQQGPSGISDIIKAAKSKSELEEFAIIGLPLGGAEDDINELVKHNPNLRSLVLNADQYDNHPNHYKFNPQKLNPELLRTNILTDIQITHPFATSTSSENKWCNRMIW